MNNFQLKSRSKMQYTVTKRIKRLSETLDMVYLVNVENIMVNVNQKKKRFVLLSNLLQINSVNNLKGLTIGLSKSKS